MRRHLRQVVLGPRTEGVGFAEGIVLLAVFDDLAAVHEDDAIADLLGESHLVRDVHHRHAFLCHRHHHVQQLAHQLGVQRAKFSAPDSSSAWATKLAASCDTKRYSVVSSRALRSNRPESCPPMCPPLWGPLTGNACGSDRRLCDGEIRVVNVAERSASAGRAFDLTAGKLTPKLSFRIADARGRQWPTLTKHPLA